MVFFYPYLIGKGRIGLKIIFLFRVIFVFLKPIKGWFEIIYGFIEIYRLFLWCFQDMK